MQEVILPKQEIDVMRFERALIFPAKETRPKRKKKSRISFERKVIIGQWFVIGVLAVMNYILRVGPI